MQLPSDAFLKTQCRKIFIHDLRLQCFIGAYDCEKDHPQEVLFNCDLWIPLDASSSLDDDLTDVLNYDRVVNTIESIAHTKHFNLQETLVDTIADALIQLPHVVLVRFSSAKTEAYANVSSVGIEVWRSHYSELSFHA